MKIPSIPTLRGIGRPGTASPIFLSDTFTGADTTVLTSHTGEIGAGWTRHSASTGNPDDLIQTNRLMGPTVSGTNVYHGSKTPTSANYEVTASIVELSDNNSSHFSVAGRMSTSANTAYYVQYNSATNNCTLNVIVAGTPTVLATAAQLATSSITLRMIGNQISGLVDGVLVLGPVTDSTITTADRAGIRHGGFNTTGAGIHADSITATVVVA